MNVRKGEIIKRDSRSLEHLNVDKLTSTKRFFQHHLKQLFCSSWDEWKSASYVKVLQGHDVYFALEECCYWYKTQDGAVTVQEVNELRSKHEEADTRMVFHANYIGMQCHGDSPTVVIRSWDTDVFVLLLYHQNHVNANIWMDTGTSSKNTRRMNQCCWASPDTDTSSLLCFASISCLHRFWLYCRIP